MIDNVIRTKVVDLMSIPAIAYKQKLESGGSAIRVIRRDVDAHGSMTVNKRAGLSAYGKIDEALLPLKAFEEAFELLKSVPYSERGRVKVSVSCPTDTEILTYRVESLEDAEEDVFIRDIFESDEYNSLIQKYTDKTDNFNIDLMNKDFIQFAARSAIVGTMIAEMASEEEILQFIVKSRTESISNSKNPLNVYEINVMMDTLIGDNGKSAFKELKAYIRKALGDSIRR